MNNRLNNRMMNRMENRMRNSTKNRMKNYVKNLLLALALGLIAVPVQTYAATQIIDADALDSGEVEAVACVDEEMLADLGLNVNVSLPMEIIVMPDENQVLTGYDYIYAFGIMDETKEFTLTIDTTNAAYGKVKYRREEGGEEVESDKNFYASVTETLSKESFSADETKANYLKDMENTAMPYSSTLTVEIADLIPTSGVGEYYTTVPVKFAIQAQ